MLSVIGLHKYNINITQGVSRAVAVSVNLLPGTLWDGRMILSLLKLVPYSVKYSTHFSILSLELFHFTVIFSIRSCPWKSAHRLEKMNLSSVVDAFWGAKNAFFSGGPLSSCRARWTKSIHYTTNLHISSTEHDSE